MRSGRLKPVTRRDRQCALARRLVDRFDHDTRQGAAGRIGQRAGQGAGSLARTPVWTTGIERNTPTRLKVASHRVTIVLLTGGVIPWTVGCREVASWNEHRLSNGLITLVWQHYRASWSACQARTRFPTKVSVSWERRRGGRDVRASREEHGRAWKCRQDDGAASDARRARE